MTTTAHGPIGIISGTGPAGAGLAIRLASCGSSVLIGSRDATRSAAVADELVTRLPDTAQATIASGTNDDAARCDLVVLATSAHHAVSTASAHADALRNSTLLSMAAALSKGTRGMKPSLPPEGSVAEALAAALPTTRVTASLHHVPAKELGDLDHQLDCDLLICGDDDGAVASVIELLEPITDGAVLDVGGLANAVALEAMTPVLLSINRTYGGRASIKIARD